MPDFKPSDVVLACVPLVGTMSRAETEFAAAMIVRACQALGDKWQAVDFQQIGTVVRADADGRVEPFARLLVNPFFKPDVWSLVARGFARWLGEPGSGPIELTDKAYEAMRRWVRQPEGRQESPAPPERGEED